MAARAMHIHQCFPHVSQTAHIYYVQTQSRLPRPLTRVHTRSDNMQNVTSARILKTTIKSPRSLCTVYHLRGLLNFTGQNSSSSFRLCDSSSDGVQALVHKSVGAIAAPIS